MHDHASLPPFLKWAGGKRWLPFYYPDLLPTNYGRYYEPFLGGGAVLFAIRPPAAVVSDANDRLIECYIAMRDDHERFASLMRSHHRNHSENYYYAVRDKRFRVATKRAAQFLYLNRTCWNGLYRVNLEGKFNVPIGTKSTVVFDGEDFGAYAAALQNVKLEVCDFEQTIARARANDFLFLDPPYTVKHNFNGFAKYNEKIFTWSDQIRLRAAIENAAARGVKVLLCNAHHDSVVELFSGLGDIHIVNRRSLIAGEARFRATVTEIAITVNYRRAKGSSQQACKADRSRSTVSRG